MNPPPANPLRKPPPHLLVADDHPELIEDVLQTFGYQITVVRDGHEAMTLLRERCLEFDLILLDIMLPGVNGFDILRSLRKNPPCMDIPVLVLTALDSDLDQVSGLKVGADDYVSKPFKIPNLLARIEALLRRSRWRSLSRGGRLPLTPGPLSPAGQQFDLQPPAPPIRTLTEREKDILSLVARGLSNREIAEHLVLSELTVKTHLKNLFRKLNVSNRTQAILVGLGQQLIS